MAQSQTDEQTAQIEQILGRIDESWRALNDELRQIPDARKVEPNVVGTWSIKDVLGHITVWDEYAAQRNEQAVGKSGVIIEAITWQERNDREAAKRAERPLEEIQTEFAQTHERLLSTVRSLVQAEPAVLAERIADLPESTFDHYAEHLEEIRAWRKA